MANYRNLIDFTDLYDESSQRTAIEKVKYCIVFCCVRFKDVTSLAGLGWAIAGNFFLSKLSVEVAEKKFFGNFRCMSCMAGTFDTSGR